MSKERCEGCRCVDCRWRGAGSHCYYNDHGTESSRCSWCMHIFFKGEALMKWKTDSCECRGYEKKWMVEK